MHRSPVCRERIGLRAPYLFVRTLHTRTYRSCKWEGMGIHTVATLVCQTWGKYRYLPTLYMERHAGHAYCSHSEGGYLHVTARRSKRIGII